MATTKSKKLALLDFLNSEVNDQKSVVFVTTKGAEKSINSVVNFDLRSKAFHAGLKVKIIKNSLLQVNNKSVAGLTGQTYMAYLINKKDTNEVVVPKSFIKLVQSDFKNNFTVVGALINGEFVDATEAIKYSNIPTRDESFGMIAGAINQLAAGIGRAVKAISEKDNEETVEVKAEETIVETTEVVA